MLSPKEVVKKWVDAFNAGDVDMIVSLYDNNATNHQVINEPVVGVVAIREMFANEFSTAKMVCIVENIFEDGQWSILEWRDPLGLRGCGFFQVVNGKILFQRGYWDMPIFIAFCSIYLLHCVLLGQKRAQYPLVRKRRVFAQPSQAYTDWRRQTLRTDGSRFFAGPGTRLFCNQTGT